MQLHGYLYLSLDISITTYVVDQLNWVVFTFEGFISILLVLKCHFEIR